MLKSGTPYSAGRDLESRTGRLNPGAQSDIYECHKNAQAVTFTTCLVNINVFALPALNVVRI